MKILRGKDILSMAIKSTRSGGSRADVPAVTGAGENLRHEGEVVTLAEVSAGETVVLEGDSYEALSVEPGEFFGAKVFRVKIRSWAGLGSASPRPA